MPRREFPRRTAARRAVIPFLTCLLLAAGFGSALRAASYTSEFRLGDCRWSARGSQNPYFNLRPGYQLVLEGPDEGELVRNTITVLDETERITLEIDGVMRSIRTRVIEERELVDGELSEVSRNFFARCRETGDVFYFGEDVDIYEDDEVVSHDGAWRAGVDGAPGIIMPGRFLLGSRYFQEVAPGIAEDRAKHVAMGLEVPTPAGTFSDCVGVVDSSTLDPGLHDSKVYCPGVGIVIDEAITLIAYGIVP